MGTHLPDDREWGGDTDTLNLVIMFRCKKEFCGIILYRIGLENKNDNSRY